MAETQYYGTGRRKTSVARVFLTRGTGEIIVNGKPIDEYFSRETSIMVVKQPLEHMKASDQFNIVASVHGGGDTGQAGALRLGVARAMVAYDEATGSDGTEPESTRRQLRSADDGFLTRDARKVERKKAGFRKARKKEQYSKR